MKIQQLLEVPTTQAWEAVSENVITYCQASKTAWDILYAHLIGDNPQIATELLRKFLSEEYRAFIRAKFEVPDPETYITYGRKGQPEFVRYKKAIKAVRSAVTAIAKILEPKEVKSEEPKVQE